MTNLITDKKVILILFTSLLLYSYQVSATNNFSFDWVIGNERKYSTVEIYTDYDISGKLVRVNSLIKPKVNFRPFCMKIIRDKNEDYRIFDFVAYKNNNLIDKGGNIFSYYEETVDGHIAEFPCFNLSESDILEISYSIGGKIKGLHSNGTLVEIFFRDFGLRMDEERYYPFDKYYVTMWSSLIPFQHTIHSAKVSIPSSYDFVFNRSSFTCPLLSEKVMYQIVQNTTNNLTYKKELMNIALFGYFQHLASQQTFLQQISGKEKNVKPFGDVVCSPLNEKVKDFIIAFGNVSSDFNKVRDIRTGVYLFVEYQRPEIIKVFFWFSLLLQFFVGILVMFSNGTKIGKTEKIIIAGFTIWAFQEGLNVLSPIIRPTMLTIYDLTPLITIAIIVFLWIKRS